MPKHVLVIDLGEQSPTRSICLPSDLGEQPSSIGLRGISTREVYQASEVTSTAGGLLPHLFTLTTGLDRCSVAVSLSAALSVKYAPKDASAFPLGSAVLCVVRTFLPEIQGDKAGRTFGTKVGEF